MAAKLHGSLRRYTQRLVAAGIASVMVVTGAAHTIFAQSQADFYSSNNILFYDANSCSANGNNSGSNSLVGTDNIEKILRYFVGKGLSLAQAAGIAGNFQQESGLNPSIKQTPSGGELVDENYQLEPGVGFGLAQWTTAGRQNNLKAFAADKKLPINDLGMQLDFTWKELSDGGMMSVDTLKTAKTPNEAAYLFHRDFEVSDDTPEEVATNRGAKAENFYTQFKAIIPDDSSKAGEINPALCTGDGKASAYTDDGFVIYNQNDPQWDKKPYGTATIGEAGCGPSSMAMIITALTKKNVTPLDTATYGAAHGTFVEGGGSIWNISGTIAPQWGLKSQKLSANVAEINSALRAGALVITSGSGPSPYTSGGHYITIRGVTGDGKWKIGDSNSTIGIENSKKEWDPGYILSNTATDNIYAVTK